MPTLPAPLPLPARLGPCLLLRPLGAGGTGTVYLAEMAEPRPYAAAGARVAVKLLHPDRLQSVVNLERFRREAEIGRSLAHGGLVRTHAADAEEVGGRLLHYLVLEYVEGVTLAELLRGMGKLPEPLIRDLGAQAAAALAAVHAAGVVHRDVKPSNIIVTPDHRVRLMDLGLARLHEDVEAVTVAGNFAGTLLYAAPEQLDGGSVGPPADLHALGCVLHEMATGTSLYAGESGTAGVMWRKVSWRPPRLRQAEPGISPFLEAVVRGLLERDPEDRLGPAKEVAALLENGERSPWWQQREAETVALTLRREAAAIPVGREAGFVGRVEERGQLAAWLAEARAGQGRIVLLTGEAGVGKSRLVAEFLARLDPEGDRALYGGFAPGVTRGRGGIADALVGELGERELALRLVGRLGPMRQLAPALAHYLLGSGMGAGEDSPGGETLRAAICQVARSFAEERTLVWVVDDLHFAPADSRALVLALARCAAEARLLLLVTSRPAVPSAELSEIERLAGTRRLPVARLGAREVIDLLRELLGSARLAEKIGGTVAQKTDGNPFFIVEMVRELKDQGALRREEDGSWTSSGDLSAIRVPSSVRGMVEARLAELADAERALLDVGAVEGFTFDADLLGRVLERRKLGVLQALAVLARRTGLVRAEGARFRFDHHQVQEVLYDALPAALRAEYHGLLAAALAAREGVAGLAADAVPGETAATLCRHYLMGERRPAGLALVLRAIDHLAGQYRNEELLSLAEIGIAALDAEQHELRFALERRRSETLLHVGRLRESAAAAERALEAARQSGRPEDEASALQRLARARHRAGELDAEESLIGQGLELARRAGLPRAEADFLLARASAREQRPDIPGALEAAKQALEIARGQRDLALQADCLSALGFLTLEIGQADDTRLLLHSLTAIVEKLGDRRRAARTRFFTALVDKDRGPFPAVRRQFEEVLAFTLESGDRRAEASTRAMHALVCKNMGDLAEAREGLERALRIQPETGAFDGLLRSLAGWVDLAEGRLEEASTAFRAALELCARPAAPQRGKTSAMQGLATIDRARGLHAAADARLAEVEALQLTGNPSGAWAAWTRLGRGAIAFESGEPERGRDLVARAAAALASQPAPGHPLLHAWQLRVGLTRDAGIEIGELYPIEERAEAHLVLHHAGAPGAHLARARALLEHLSRHLTGADRDRFWTWNLTASRLREAEARG